MLTRTILTLPYQLTRGPLVLLDVQFAQRLPQDSVPRLMFDRALGSYDRFAGRLLGDADLVRRGSDRVERSGNIAHAVVLEREAAERREAAEAVATEGEQQAEETARQAHDRLASGLEEAEAAERDGKRAAAAAARVAAERKKKQADQRAAQRLAGVKRSVNQTEKTANARATNARKAAKAKLDDASDQRAKARARRADATQLAQLTTAKRQSRTTKS